MPALSADAIKSLWRMLVDLKTTIMSNLEQTSELKQIIHNHLLEVSNPRSFNCSAFSVLPMVIGSSSSDSLCTPLSIYFFQYY